MEQGTERSVCEFCGQALALGQVSCPRCAGAANPEELAAACDFAKKCFVRWAEVGVIESRRIPGLNDYFDRLQRAAGTPDAAGFGGPAMGLPPAEVCVACGTTIDTSYQFCAGCGIPANNLTTLAARQLQFANAQMPRLEREGLLSLSEVHACVATALGQLRATHAELQRGRLNSADLASTRLDQLRRLKERGPSADAPAAGAGDAGGGDGRGAPASMPPLPAGAPAIPPPIPQRFSYGPPPIPGRPPAPPRRTVGEILLDPKSIQWLLASGGVLLVVGVVIWLASLRIFESPVAIATAMGGGNLALMACGWLLIKKTRFQVAGRAITLLACLLMPLNLWFYQANDLMVVGGQLWIAALACCALYAVSAIVLKDALFVYVLMGGVTMTGLLLMAEMHALASISGPTIFLIGLGLITIHVERGFKAGDGPFSRGKFGLAFFFSGQVIMGLGLVILLMGQIADWIWIPVMSKWHMMAPPISVAGALSVSSLILVLAAAYAYLYSDLVVRKKGAYIYPAAFTLLWAQIIALRLMNLHHATIMAMIVLAVTGLTINIAQAVLSWRTSPVSAAARPLAPLALWLALVPVVLGVWLYARATELALNHIWPFTMDFAFVVATLINAVCCRAAAWLRRTDRPDLVRHYLFASAAALLVGVAGLLSLWGVGDWSVQAPLLMLIPICYLLASRMWSDPNVRAALSAVAQTAAIVMLVSIVLSALHITPRVVEPIVGHPLNLLLALFFAEAAAYFILSARFNRTALPIYLASASVCAAMWQLLNYWHVAPQIYTLIYGALGLVLLFAHRRASPDRPGSMWLAKPAFDSGNALLAIACAAGTLLTVTRLARTGAEGSLVWMMFALAGMCLVAARLIRHPQWRHWYLIAAICEAGLAMLTLQMSLHLNPWRSLELFTIGVGVILLVIGHWGWYREQNAHSDLVSFCIVGGSLLVGMATVAAVLVHRATMGVSLPDELIIVTAGILLFVSGVLCQIRATTLTGGTMLATHLLILIVSIGMAAQLKVGVYLTIGGALIFGAGIILSIFRDKLIALPDRIRRREGIFRVLTWR